jgi:hypothetical protein
VERRKYPNGPATDVRPIRLWLDTEAYLLRKMVEDTPEGGARGWIDQRIVTLNRKQNPRLEARVFRFTVPAQ